MFLLTDSCLWVFAVWFQLLNRMLIWLTPSKVFSCPWLWSPSCILSHIHDWQTTINSQETFLLQEMCYSACNINPFRTGKHYENVHTLICSLATHWCNQRGNITSSKASASELLENREKMFPRYCMNIWMLSAGHQPLMCNTLRKG